MRTTQIFSRSCASQKAPEPPESEPHTVRLTSTCRASKPWPSLTARHPGQKLKKVPQIKIKKKSWPVEKVGAADSANRPIARAFTLSFSPCEKPRTGGPNPDPRSPACDLTLAHTGSRGRSGHKFYVPWSHNPPAKKKSLGVVRPGQRHVPLVRLTRQTARSPGFSPPFFSPSEVPQSGGCGM